MAIRSITLLRHGESSLTAGGRFAGWTDVDLSSKGEEEALRSAKLIAHAGLQFQVIFTSVLRRSIETARIIESHLREVGVMSNDQDVVEYHRWQLNERCYGQLEGRNKKECSAEFGAQQVRLWRRSFCQRPPPLAESDPRWPGRLPMYTELGDKVPNGESPADVEERVLSVWESEILLTLKEGRNVLVVAHGTSLRCLTKIIEGLSVDEIETLEIPSGAPIVYDIDTDTGKVVNKRSLISQDELERKAEEVRMQSELDASRTPTRSEGFHSPASRKGDSTPFPDSSDKVQT